MKFTLILIVSMIALSLSGCSDDAQTLKVLTDQGYTKVVTTGYAFFGCDKNDTFSTGFTAISPAGRQVSGVVCSGWMKGATIRFK